MSSRNTRWFQFSLRRLLAVSLLAVLAAWILNPFSPVDDVGTDEYGRIALFNPTTTRGSQASLPPPSDDQVVALFMKKSPVGQSEQLDNVRIVKDKIADYVDPVTVLPKIGTAQVHHAHYKCTIYYTRKSRESRTTVDDQDVLYVDHYHHHKVARGP